MLMTRMIKRGGAFLESRSDPANFLSEKMYSIRCNIGVSGADAGVNAKSRWEPRDYSMRLLSFAG